MLYWGRSRKVNCCSIWEISQKHEKGEAITIGNVERYLPVFLLSSRGDRTCFSSESRMAAITSVHIVLFRLQGGGVVTELLLL